MRHATLAALAIVAGANAALAQAVSYTGGAYAQNFNGLPMTGSITLTGRGPHSLDGLLGSTGMAGWYYGNFLGSSGNAEFRAQNGSVGSSSGRGVVSFGTTDAPDRALGCLPTSNQVSTFGALFANNTTSTITSVTISYRGEQWRRGNVITANTLTFAYGIVNSIDQALSPKTELNFSTPNMQEAPLEVALDGNDPANTAQVSSTISGLEWAPGTILAIAWTINDNTGQDNALAVDDFTLTADAGGATACSPADIASAGSSDPQAGPDGFITGEDFDLFVQAYFTELRRTSNNTLIADITDGTGQQGPDGFLTGTDFDAFVQLYFVGC